MLPLFCFSRNGRDGESSEPVANYLQDRYFCILPTSTVYCKGQKYVSKADEVRQVEEYLKSQGWNALNWLWLLRSVLTLPWRFDRHEAAHRTCFL